MKRDLTELTRNAYDVLIIGGGIYGACVAREATLRGLSVALVEKADFGSATSANSLKIIHGGFRYLQHADFRRMRMSFHEQSTLMRIAPHLVHPLPVLIPTYGHGAHGREIFLVALAVNDLIGLDRNRFGDPQKLIPRGRTISREECLRLLPRIPRQRLSGGAIFYDAQVYNSERLLLSFLRSAEKAGADLANYVAVIGFLQEGGRVIGVEAKDTLTGQRFDIRAHTVVNASGPWLDCVLSLLRGHHPRSGVRFAKAVNLLTHSLFQTYAVGIASHSAHRDTDAVLNKGHRLLFITPWRGQSLIGTAYTVYEGHPDGFKVTEEDVRSFMSEINRSCPSLDLKSEDILLVHGGLVPISSTGHEMGYVQLTRRHRIYDHRCEGMDGLISVVGVKYTTARHVAEKTVDLVFEKMGQRPPSSASSITPLYGGQIGRFEDFLHTTIRNCPCGLDEEAVRHLVYNYGSAYLDVLRYLNQDVRGERGTPDRLALLRAEILHAIREEMAQKLSDVIFRRTELGTAGHPGDDILRFCAKVMGTELNWNETRVQRELQEVRASFVLGS